MLSKYKTLKKGVVSIENKDLYNNKENTHNNTNHSKEKKDW